MKRRCLRAAVLAVGLPLLSLQPCLSHAGDDGPWQLDAGVTLARNDNIGNAERSRDIVDDNFAILTLGAGYRWQFDMQQSLFARGFLETEQLEEVRDLSRYTLGGQLNYRYRINPKPDSLSLQANLIAQVDEYEHSQRDSNIITAQLVASQPIGERVTTSVGVEYRSRDSSGSVWDLNQARGFLSGQFAFRPTWSAYGTYSYIDGDVASTAQTVFKDGTPADDIFGLVSAAKDIEPDKAFNNEFDGNWLAYRLSAFTHTVKLGMKKDFANDFGLDLSVLRVIVNAKEDNEYKNWVYRLSLQKRF